MAEELLQIIRDSRYNPTIVPLNHDDVMTKKDFMASRLSSDFWLDTRHCFVNRKRNPMCMYQLFANWSNDDPSDLKDNILSLIEKDYSYYDRISKFWTKFKGISFDTWIYDQVDRFQFADELMLFILCREFNRHCVVHTKTKTWSTIQSDVPIPEETLHGKCDLILLFMGRGLFGALKRKPSSLAKLPNDLNPYLKPKVDRRTRSTVLDLSIKGYEAMQIQMALAENQYEDAHTLPAKNEKREKKEEKQELNVETYPKLEGTDTYSLNCSATNNSVSLDVPDYVRNIQELPSFEDENNDNDIDNTDANILQLETSNDTSHSITVNSPNRTNIMESTTDVNLNTIVRGRNELESDNTTMSLEQETDVITTPLYEGVNVMPHGNLDLITEPDPIFDSLFFPEIETSDVAANQDNAVDTDNLNVNQKTVVVQEVDATAPSLQDIVKSFMLGEHYPYPISMDEIARICKLPIMRIKIATTVPQPMRPCKVIVKKLKQLDLAKLGLISNSVSTDNEANIASSSSESETMQPNADEDYLPDLSVPAARYPKRTVSTVNYQSDPDSTRDEPVTKKRKIMPTGLKTPSRSRMLSQNMGATKNPVCRPKYVTIKPQDNSSGTDNESANQDNININPDDDLPVLRDTTTSTNNNANKKHRKRGFLNIVHHHRDKPKKTRKFNCDECDVQENSLAELNSHYRNTHGVVTCKTCNKTFSTPSTLTRHSYSHGPQKHACTKKGCNFRSAFASELERHKLVHRTIATHQCQFANCERWYFSKDELNKHVRIHDGKRWDCEEIGCDYSTPDKRLLKQHYRKHSGKKPYECGLCHKSFTYHTQYSRHVRNDVCEATPTSK